MQSMRSVLLGIFYHIPWSCSSRMSGPPGLVNALTPEIPEVQEAALRGYVSPSQGHPKGKVASRGPRESGFCLSLDKP